MWRGRRGVYLVTGGCAVGEAAAGTSLLSGGGGRLGVGAALLGGCGGDGSWKSRRKKWTAASVTKEAGEGCCWLGVRGEANEPPTSGPGERKGECARVR